MTLWIGVSGGIWDLGLVTLVGFYSKAVVLDIDASVALSLRSRIVSLDIQPIYRPKTKRNLYDVSLAVPHICVVRCARCSGIRASWS